MNPTIADIAALGLEVSKEKRQRVLKHIRNLQHLLKATEHEVTEECPHCSHENIFKWNLSDGYKTYCASCGQIMLLCSKCSKL